MLFDLVAPQEYGFDAEAKEEIGVLTSLPLLRKVWGDLEEAKTTGKSLACFYFTKESHITTFVHLLLASGMPFTNVRIPELDYCSHVTIELWEKSTPRNGQTVKDFSIRLSISEGAHSPAVLDSNVDAVSVNGRRNALHRVGPPRRRCGGTASVSAPFMRLRLQRAALSCCVMFGQPDGRTRLGSLTLTPAPLPHGAAAQEAHDARRLGPGREVPLKAL